MTVPTWIQLLVLASLVTMGALVQWRLTPDAQPLEDESKSTIEDEVEDGDEESEESGDDAEPAQSQPQVVAEADKTNPAQAA